MKELTIARCVALVLVSLLVGAIAGGGVVYNRVVLPYRTQYEEICLAIPQCDLRLVEKLRNGKTAEVIKACDVSLGRTVLGLRKEVKHSPGEVSYVLWQIKNYYRDYRVPAKPELEALLRQIPDKEPYESQYK